nr:FapA family protein [Pseudoalteromonas sp. CnMc7-15]
MAHNGNVLFNVTQETPAPPSKAAMLEALQQSEFAGCKVDDEHLDKFYSGEESGPSIVVGKRVDATLEVTISDDKMSAMGRLTTAQGGKALDLEAGKKAIVVAGVRRGYQQALLEKLLQQQFELAPGSSVKGTLARGRLPVDGQPSELVKQTQTLKDRINKPKRREDGTVDMRDFGKLASVQPGTVLMIQKPATPGKEGFTVTGDVLEAKPGEQLSLIPGEGTELNPDNPLELRATVSGVPVESPNGMRVDDIFTIKEVNVKSGHIDFDGSVVITHNVEPGMRVTAKGEISVLGTVESGILNATGDITIKQGTIGHPNHQQNDAELTCQINAGGNLHISHAQYCYLEATNIYIERQASHCQLKALESLIVGPEESPNGKLFGGEVLDACRLEAGEIGSESGAKMRINLVARGADITADNDACVQQLSQTDDKLASLQDALEKAEAIKDAEKKKQLIEKIGATQLALVQQADELETKLSSLDNTLHSLLDGANLVAHQRLNSGVEIHIFDKVLKTARQYPPCVVKLEKSKIEVEFKTS